MSSPPDTPGITVLHLSATPSFTLALWGEHLARGSRRWSFASDAVLRRALSTLWQGERLPPTPSIPDLEILWPAHRLDPCPSPTLQAFLLTSGVGSADQPTRLRATRVAALQVSAAVAHRLTSLERLHHLHLAPDALFWSRLSADAVALVASGRFAPRLVSVPGGAALRWVPLIEYGEELIRGDAFSQAMPDAARAAHSQAAPQALVREVLGRMVDGLVRQLGGGRREPSLHGSSLQTYQGLLRTGPEVVLPDAVVEQLGAAGAEAGLPARVTFRLVPSSDGPWTVEFLLQDRKDPSLLAGADLVWRREAGLVMHFARYGHDPEELLLRGLARAGRVSDLVRRALDDTTPRGVSCSVGEAYGFLTREAGYLELLGFGMLLPSWWRRRGSRHRLGLRGRVRRSSRKQDSGGLGAESIVQFDWQLAMGEAALSRNDLLRLAALKQPLVEVRGQWVELTPDFMSHALILLERGQEMSLAQALMQTSPDEEMPLLGIEGEGDLEGLLAQLQARTPIEPVPSPRELCGQLRPYQQRGLDWLAFLTRHGLGGCLADDMGLGKTVQAIALILHRREHGCSRPTLLICPTSVVTNWQRELSRFAPSVSAALLLSSSDARQLHRMAHDVDVVIASYGLLSRNTKQLAGIEWDGVILDEAGNVKNLETARARAVRGLRSAYRLTLTGTPVENRLSELHAILSFANPGFLGSETSFRQRYALPIEKWDDGERAEELQRIVQPFILRRTKTDPEIAADLPEKREAEVPCALTSEQATLYKATVDEMLARIETSEGIERRGLVLSTIAKLKQICNHPANFLKDGSPLAGRSGKLTRLEEMLAEVADVGERALIFTQFAEFGEQLAEYLQEALGVPVPFYHGGLTMRARDRIVDAFQSLEGPGALLVSVRAGGVGLNLTAANHVFHYDRWWNPAVEDQATDRAFRFGQTRDVMVYKFLTNGTVETHIADMIAGKRKLAGLIVRAGESWLTELSTDDLRDILTLDPFAA